MRLKYSLAWLPLCLAFVTTPGRAADLLPNGDFEAGFLIGWLVSERKDGIADIVREGNCFAEEDTTHITIAGDYAAILRSGPSGRRSSVGILTSEPFVAGDGILFTSLTGTRDGKRIIRPVEFEVRVLNAEGETLTAHEFSTSVVRLKHGCPSEPRDGRFYVHYIDTRKFLDQSISIQFRQNTNTGGIQPFTLIDRVVKFEKGEGPVYASRPVAVASTSKTRVGKLRLDATHSFDPDEGPAKLSYRWQIDGEKKVRLGNKPCVGDLTNGEYTATLFVNDGFHVSSDSLQFAVRNNPAVTTEGNDSDTNNYVVTIPGCDNEDEESETSVDDNEVVAIAPVMMAGSLSASGEMGDNLIPSIDLDADDSNINAGNNFSVTFTVGDSAIDITDTDVSIEDEDDDYLHSAIVSLVEKIDDNDKLVLSEGTDLAGGIIASLSTGNDSVTLSGPALHDDYIAAIKSVKYINDGDTPDTSETRTIQFRVNDGAADSSPALTSVTVETE